MILVTGATGGLGKAAIEFLLKKVSADDISALVRNKSKAGDIESKGVQIRYGDYNDYPSLVKAFTGINKLFFISGSDIAGRKAQHLNIIRAAKETGVKHVMYTSFQRKTE